MSERDDLGLCTMFRVCACFFLFLVDLELESSISLTVTISDKSEAGLLEVGVVVASSLVTTQTTPDSSGLESFSVTVWSVKDHQVIVVSVALAASLGSEQSQVKRDILTALAADVPSALAVCRVQSWVVFSLNPNATRVDLELVRAGAHEECGLEDVAESETVPRLNWVSSEIDVNSSWVGDFEGSSHSAQAKASAAFWCDLESIVAVKVDFAYCYLNILGFVVIDKLPLANLVVRVGSRVVFTLDNASTVGDGGLSAARFSVVAHWAGFGGRRRCFLTGQPCGRHGSPKSVVVLFPILVIKTRKYTVPKIS